jgi:1,4-alpha-glucan branching enzyme
MARARDDCMPEPGRQSAVTLGATPYSWSNSEATWTVPTLADLIMYEVNLAEFDRDLAGATKRLDYLADLGITCLSVMPITNVASEVDWGYLPVGYFGVDERFGGNETFKAFVDGAHSRGLAVIVDAVYGHASRALFAYRTSTTDSPTQPTPSWVPSPRTTSPHKGRVRTTATNSCRTSSPL